MRKAPPKTHTYTIILLLMIIGVAGGVVAMEYTGSTSSGSDVASETTRFHDDSNALEVQSSSGSGSETRQNSLNPQQAARQLQPASGEQVYDNYDSQSTAQPGQRE